jgi:hypothetical protein
MSSRSVYIWYTDRMRMFYRTLKKRPILWVHWHWRSNFKNKHCLSRENQSWSLCINQDLQTLFNYKPIYKHCLINILSNLLQSESLENLLVTLTPHLSQCWIILMYHNRLMQCSQWKRDFVKQHWLGGRGIYFPFYDNLTWLDCREYSSQTGFVTVLLIIYMSWIV